VKPPASGAAAPSSSDAMSRRTIARVPSPVSITASRSGMSTAAARSRARIFAPAAGLPKTSVHAG
jgi:hypothetical protein